MASPTQPTKEPKRSLLSLVTDIPGLIQELFHREVELLKAEVIGKLKALGVGAGLLAGAAVVLLFLIGVLLTSAILALAQVMPGWLAALLVAAFLLIVAAILALIGYRILKRGIPPIPTETIDSVQRDYRAIRGMGKAEDDMSIPGSKAQTAKEQAEKARDELAATLDAIEDKLNVPKRVGELKDKATASYQQNKTPWLIGAGSAAAVVIGLIAWAIFSDD